jgi:hypothetical protein
MLCVCTFRTKSECAFYNGIFHVKHQLCSEVSCLGATCEPYFPAKEIQIKNWGNDFGNYPRNILLRPNQWWRFIVPLGLHAGIIHFVLCMMLQWPIGCQIERTAGQCWVHHGRSLPSFPPALDAVAPVSTC